MGEPARKIELTSSLSPKQSPITVVPEVLPRITPNLSDDQKVRQLKDADRARIKSRFHNPKERRLEQYAELQERLQIIESTRSQLLDQLKKFAEEEAMIKTGKLERDDMGNLVDGVGSMGWIEKVHMNKTGEDIAAKEKAKNIKGLIKILNLNYVFGYGRLSEDIIKALKRCENCDSDLISAILFIFGASGSRFDLESMDFSKLNPSIPADRDAIEELLVFLNEKTILAMNTIEDTLAEDRMISNIKRESINKRIMLVEKALKDFEPVKVKYLKNKRMNKGIFVPDTPTRIEEDMGVVIDIANKEAEEDAA